MYLLCAQMNLTDKSISGQPNMVSALVLRPKELHVCVSNLVSPKQLHFQMK